MATARGARWATRSASPSSASTWRRSSRERNLRCGTGTRCSDELVYVLEGELVVRLNDGEFPLRPGMLHRLQGGEPRAHITS
jgi:hypothetical protein